MQKECVLSATKLNYKSVCAEASHDALAEKLKINKSYRVVFEMQEEECVEAEDMKNK